MDADNETYRTIAIRFRIRKQYENVAGCLITYGCKESFKLNNA